MAKAKSQYNFIINADVNVINQIIFDYLRANNFEQKQENGCVYYEQYNALTGRCLFEYNIAGNQVTIWAYVGSYKSPKELSGFVGALPKQAYRDSLQLLFNHLEALNHPQNSSPQSNVQAPNTAYPQNNAPQPNVQAPNTAYPQNSAPQPNVQAPNTAYPQNNAPQPNVQTPNTAYPQNNAPQPNVQTPNTAYPQNNAPQQQAFDYQPNMQQTNAFEQQNKKSRDNWTIAGFVISIVGLFLSFFGIVYGVIIIVLEYYLGITGLKSNKKGLAVATIVLSSISLLITIFMIIVNVLLAVS